MLNVKMVNFKVLILSIRAPVQTSTDSDPHFFSSFSNTNDIV